MKFYAIRHNESGKFCAFATGELVNWNNLKPHDEEISILSISAAEQFMDTLYAAEEGPFEIVDVELIVKGVVDAKTHN